MTSTLRWAMDPPLLALHPHVPTTGTFLKFLECSPLSLASGPSRTSPPLGRPASTPGSLFSKTQPRGALLAPAISCASLVIQDTGLFAWPHYSLRNKTVLSHCLPGHSAPAEVLPKTLNPRAAEERHRPPLARTALRPGESSSSTAFTGRTTLANTEGMVTFPQCLGAPRGASHDALQQHAQPSSTLRKRSPLRRPYRSPSLSPAEQLSKSLGPHSPSPESSHEPREATVRWKRGSFKGGSVP